MDIKVEYICALTNLYGHVLPEKVCAVYNEQNDDTLDTVEFEMYLTDPGGKIEDRFVYIKRGEFIEETLYLFEKKYEKLCAKQEGKPHYVPEKEKLCEYADLNYWERPLEYDELEEYIVANFFPQQVITGKNLADEIFYHISEDNFEGAFPTLIQYEVVIEDKEELEIFLYILQRLNNNTRMRAHNGYTPIELSKLTGEPVYIVPIKALEENADCHCGSKKKYKDCHMNDDSKIKRLNEYRNQLKNQ